jgi:hypothetical protein
MTWPPTLPSMTPRTNTTAQTDVHPDDHNLINQWLKELQDRTYAAKFTITAPVSVPNATQQLVTWNNREWQNSPGGVLSIAAGSRLILPVAGVYTVHGCHRWTATGSLYRQGQLRLNSGDVATGGTRLALTNAAMTPTQATFIPISCLVNAAAGDYIQMFVSQGESAPQSLDPNDTCLHIGLLR